MRSQTRKRADSGKVTAGIARSILRFAEISTVLKKVSVADEAMRCLALPLLEFEFQHHKNLSQTMQNEVAISYFLLSKLYTNLIHNEGSDRGNWDLREGQQPF